MVMMMMMMMMMMAQFPAFLGHTPPCFVPHYFIHSFSHLFIVSSAMSEVMVLWIWESVSYGCMRILEACSVIPLYRSTTSLCWVLMWIQCNRSKETITIMQLFNHVISAVVIPLQDEGLSMFFPVFSVPCMYCPGRRPRVPVYFVSPSIKIRFR